MLDCRRRRMIWLYEVSLFEEVASKIALPTPITIMKTLRDVIYQIDIDRRDTVLDRSIDLILDKRYRISVLKKQ